MPSVHIFAYQSCTIVYANASRERKRNEWGLLTVRGGGEGGGGAGDLEKFKNNFVVLQQSVIGLHMTNRIFVQ